VWDCESIVVVLFIFSWIQIKPRYNTYIYIYNVLYYIVITVAMTQGSTLEECKITAHLYPTLLIFV